MSFMYATHYVNTTGMITEAKIPLAADGKKVYFDIEGGNIAKSLFTVIDGKFKAFDNNSRMETPVRGFERICPTSNHEGSLIVIDKRPVCVEVGNIPDAEIPFNVSTGKKIILTLGANVRITLGVADAETLAANYCEGVIGDPVQRVTDVATDAFYRAKGEVLAQQRGSANDEPMEFINHLGSFARELSDVVKQYVMLDLPWARVDSCIVSLNVLNMENVVTAVNEGYEVTKSILLKFTDAMCASYNVPVIPAEMSQVLAAYVNANPGGVTTEQLEKICDKLVALSKHASPEDMLKTVKKIGLLA